MVCCVGLNCIVNEVSLFIVINIGVFEMGFGGIISFLVVIVFFIRFKDGGVRMFFFGGFCKVCGFIRLYWFFIVVFSV